MHEFFKFAVTGGLGSITNLAVFFIFADKAGFPEVPVSIGCFFIAATQNYFLNHRWSFEKSTRGGGVSFAKWALFIAGSLLGLGVNIAVMGLILLRFTLPYKFIAQAAGIGAGMLLNFAVSKKLVFRKTDAGKNRRRDDNQN
jgi:putative flippase GtrA